VKDMKAVACVLVFLESGLCLQ